MSTITYSELIRAGLTSNAIAALERAGRIHRLRRGVYTYGRDDDALLTHRDLVAATWRVVDPSNVLSHTTAAALHGLPVRTSALELVTMTRTTTGHADKGPHLRVRNTRLTEEEVTLLDGMRITTLARTVSDVARLEPLRWGVAAADRGLQLGLEKPSLETAIRLHPRLQGVRRARTVAELASPLSESPAESISRVHILQAGLPAPEQQVEIYDEQGEFVARVDFLWRDHGVVGEVDGAGKYGELLPAGVTPQDAVMAEKSREGRLRALGYWTVRWDWRTANEPASLVQAIAPALGTSSRPETRGFTVPDTSHQRSR